MADVFMKATGSQVMPVSAAPATKKLDLALIRVFRKHRITGWRRHQRVFGKPDFVFPKLKLAIFVDGCFWHQCPDHSNIPANNRPFWKRKLAANQRRDKLVNKTLRRDGWRVLRLWEHELRRGSEASLLRRLRRELSTNGHESARKGKIEECSRQGNEHGWTGYTG